MNDDRRDRGSKHHRAEEAARRHDRGGSGGPPDTQFLNLEMSKVLLSDAEELATDAARSILRDAIRERLEQRLGDRLRAVGQIVADALADDVEANLAIESKIQAHADVKKGLADRVRKALSALKE